MFRILSSEGQVLQDVCPKSLVFLDITSLAVDLKTVLFILICDGRWSLQVSCHGKGISEEDHYLIGLIS